ncbi:MAG: hypothetical protein RIC15_08950 [Vicingaceae bacterium]
MRIVIATFCLLFLQAASAAEKVYVPFFYGENVSHRTLISATTLFAEYMNDNGFFQAIVSQKRDTVKFESNLNEVRESAELMSASYYTIGKIIRLGSSYNVSVKLYTNSNNLLLSSEIRQCKSLDDLPVILKELAGKLGTMRKFSRRGDLELISGSAAEKPIRLKSNKSIGVITGAMLPMNADEIKNINGGFGAMMSFDTRSYILQLSGEVYYGNDSVASPFVGGQYQNRYFNVGANVLYPLNSTYNAPFVCLGSAFTYRETVVKMNALNSTPPSRGSREFDAVDTGLTFTGGGGYILRRSSDATLFIYGRGYVYMPAVDQLVYGVMFNLALTFGW